MMVMVMMINDYDNNHCDDDGASDNGYDGDVDDFQMQYNLS